MDKLKMHSFNSMGRNIEMVKAIAQMKPYYAIFRGCETYGSDMVRKVL